MHFGHGAIRMAYHTFGQGPEVLIALHGFGRSGADFSVFEGELGEMYTLHAFDLPFHGASPSPSERAITPFEPDELRAFFMAFADHIGADRVMLMGYSLGGRIALSLLETMPHRITKAMLIAPDGLHTRPWYRVFARLHWGRRRYAHFIDHPGRMHAMANALRTLGIMKDKMHRFVIGQTDTRAKRQLLHDVWLSFRHIEPDLDHVALNLEEHEVSIMLVFGTKDSVIRPALAERFRPKAPEHITTMLVDAGHQLLTPELARRIRQHLGA